MVALKVPLIVGNHLEIVGNPLERVGNHLEFEISVE
jgi:hypothetical protein